MKASLHLGPHGTGTSYVRNGLLHNRALLANAGVFVIGGDGVRIPEALNEHRADIAINEFARQEKAIRGEPPAEHASPVIACAFDEFFSAHPARRKEYENAFTLFVGELAKRGYEVEMIFVERDVEDLLTSYALRHIAMGNLQFVTNDPGPYLRYLTGFFWLKTFYFERFPMTHLDFRHLTRQADLLVNFARAAYRVELPLELPGVPHAVSDADLARGLVAAPLVNWMEQFGSLPRRDMFQAPKPIESPVTGGSWDAMVAHAALLRDSVRGNARRALDMFQDGHPPYLA